MLRLTAKLWPECRESYERRGWGEKDLEPHKETNKANKTKQKNLGPGGLQKLTKDHAGEDLYPLLRCRPWAAQTPDGSLRGGAV